MKVAHLVSTFPPYHGGMGTVAWQLSKNLVALGEEVTVLTPSASNDTEETVDGVRVLRIHSPFRKGNASNCRWILRWVQGYDVVHLHWPFIGGAEWVWWGFFRRRLLNPQGFLPKLVIHYHMDLIAPGYRSIIFSIVQRWILPRLIRIANAVVTTSTEYQENSPVLHEAARSTTSVYHTIPLGVDATLFTPGSAHAILRQRWGIEPGVATIGFVGSIDSAHYFKGIPQLLSAFSILTRTLSQKRFTLLIVGEGDQLNRYQRIVHDAGLEQSVHFVGRVSDEDLPHYYRLMDCLVLPSTTRSEAFGLVLLEAMASARAVVASNLPGVRTLIQEGVNGRLVEPGNHEHLAQVLIDLFNDPSLLSRMGANGRTLIEHHYQWPAVAAAWQELYRSL